MSASQASSMEASGSDALTEGIRVVVRPSYLESHSDPGRAKFIFSYHVTIANEGAQPARLRSRQLLVVDAEGNRREVNGLGVVGQFPDLAPGRSFEYSTFCPLSTPWGTMEGTFLMERPDGALFEAKVGRFFLVGPKRDAATPSR